jgi:serine/threonine protein kinase
VPPVERLPHRKLNVNIDGIRRPEGVLTVEKTVHDAPGSSAAKDAGESADGVNSAGTSEPSKLPPTQRGTPFGRYRLIELLGRGGMGEVWRALDTEANNRTVAIKLLPAHLAGDSSFVQRFRREAEAAAQLNNPHIIPIHNYGEIDGQLYVDMRLVEGRDLQDVLSAGPLEPARAVRIIEQVAKALQAAHKVGLVHRDVKPSNILVDDDDFAYLIDFGIARGADQTGLTGTGNMIGSLHYMAPERLQAQEADARADIYALACVLYECLTGSRPFRGDSLESQVAAHLTEPPPQPSSQSNVPSQLDAVIARGMAKNPNVRYPTTIELATAARDAITVPNPRPAPSTPSPPPTRQAMFPPTEQGHDAAAFRPNAVAPERSANPLPPPWPAPAPYAPASSASSGRGVAIALIGGAIALVAVVAIVVGIFVVGKFGQKSSSPTASEPPTAESFGTQTAPPSTKPWSGPSVAPGAGGAGATKVIIDGVDQNVSGTVVCMTSGGNVNISIGGASAGVAAVVTDANPPVVKSVGLGNVNGVTLAYSSGMGGAGDASATKNGNSYKISGTATGVDMANPTAPVKKPFEIDVTCP